MYSYASELDASVSMKCDSYQRHIQNPVKNDVE